ncbi:hypothetical protein B0H12DRAFT_1074509 [Mycena haematopus]|nr:hypothetical protein B0H12DRAFT_1074509 [Mycena haematopus]
MTSGTAANTAIPRSNREEFMAVLATVDQLVARSLHLARTAQELQQRLPAVLDRLTEKEAADSKSFPLFALPSISDPPRSDVWVRANAKTPAQVHAEHTAAPEGSRPWWVVYVGREPGLYTTVEEADAQIKNCPNQQYRRKASKQEALNLYIEKYDAGEVAKWVELKD